MTTLYLMRHSEPFKQHRGIEILNESIFITNKKNPLSVSGEKYAEQISNNEEFQNIDVVWSSDYVRAMSTAKYFADKNNIKVNVSYKLGERKQGIEKWEDLPNDFEKRQMEDDNYKINDGENQVETRKRMEDEIFRILNENKNKRILIVGHATAITFFLKKWCDIEYQKPFMFKGKEIYNGKWNYCDTFKLDFDDNNQLINIKNIKF